MDLRNVLNIWGGGQLLAFSGLDGTTDYNDGLVLRTAFGRQGIEVKSPGACDLMLATLDDHGLCIGGDFLTAQTQRGPLRAAFIDTHHFLIEGPCTVGTCSDKIATAREGRRLLVGSADHFRRELIGSDLDTHMARRSAWLESRVLPNNIGAAAISTLAKAYSQMKTQVYSPEGRIHHRFTTPDRWPHKRMWLWDSAFHAIGWRHIDHAVARDMLCAVLDLQTETGFIPISGSPFDQNARYTQPPVLALAAAMVDSMDPDRAWREWVFPRLERYVEWDLANRDTDGAGLVEWAIEGHTNCRSGESGLDNSPRFDTATQLDAVDFNSMLALEAEQLSAMAHSLGRADRQAYWTDHHRNLCGLINKRLWNESTGFYHDYDVTRNEISPVIANTGFLPLICGAASREQAAALVKTLHDQDLFATPLPVPTIAAGDVAHYAKDMWRGPVWINLNWLIIYGLRRYGYHDEAASIREASLREIERQYLKHGSIFEFFDDRKEVDPPQLLRKGKLAPEQSPYHQVFFDYGWTATLYADMLHAG